MSVTIKKKGSIRTIMINRAEVKNAVDGPTASALAEAFREFDDDDESYVAVLCGAGDTFCAGADLKAVSEPEKGLFNILNPDGDGPMGPSRMILSKPVIAAVSGYAVAGGLELALWCDMRVIEETAVLGVFCRRFGVPLIDGGTIRLPRLIGMSRAMDLILTGRPVEADEALSIGLANRVVGHGEGIAAAEELAETIAKFPQKCMRSDRMSAYEQWHLSIDDAILNEYNRGLDVVNSGETVNGAKKFTNGIGKHGKFEV
ncbi:MAG: crotonase/enoyl-CoA hydratase family protein [Deltaproteobacteria bacterium]|nr:crotonase/enoyl-CoA hydratase family protein [Deltaproteobacteria bacterium]